jgi:hypothetical protein
MEAVRQALAHFGGDARPSAMRPWIKEQFGIDMSADHISTYKGDIRRKQAARAQSTASPSPAVAAARAAKPAATRRPAAKKSAAPRPQPQKATAPQGASGISLEDLQAVKDLVGRVGPDRLRALIDLFAR